MQNVDQATVAPSIEAAPIVTTPATTKAKRAPKAAKQATSAKPAKAVKPAKPATGEAQAKRDAARVAAQTDADATRALAAKFYNGASLAAHKTHAAKRSDYIARALSPVQKPAGGNPSTRDESGLALILSKADKSGSFDPVAVRFDLGILSRLSSVGLVSYAKASDSFTLTPTGLSRARAIVKRAA